MFDRLRRGRRPSPDELADALRSAIVRLDTQRSEVASAAGRALVAQAEITRQCREQLGALSEAFAVADDAQVTVARAAAHARADDDPAVEQYEVTVAALQGSQQVLGAAAEPIHALLAGATDNVERARSVLGEARAVLDAQLREQLRALHDLERAERRRTADRWRRADP